MLSVKNDDVIKDATSDSGDEFEVSTGNTRCNSPMIPSSIPTMSGNTLKPHKSREIQLPSLFL